MAAASSLPEVIGVPCAPQYCSSMAMAAEPQPSSVCLMNGTSSQTPGVSDGTARRARAAKKLSNKPANTRGIAVVPSRYRTSAPEQPPVPVFSPLLSRLVALLVVLGREPFGWESHLKYYLKNNDQYGNQHDRDDQRALDPARRKVALDLPRTRSHLRQVVVAQIGDGLVHLLVVDLRRSQRLLGNLGSKQLAHRGFVRTADLRGTHRIFRQLVHRDHVLLVLPLCLRPR